MVAGDIEFRKVELTLGRQSFRFNFTIKAEEIAAICGPSGSGKSTVLNLISGFERPDSGHIFIGEREVSADQPSERPVASIFQDHNLFAHLDVFTNVALGANSKLRLSHAEKSTVSSALERVGLKGFEKRKPGDLSGGERQRAAIARVLVQNHPIMLLDEPFAALDPSLRREMADLVLSLKRETGRTVVFVTHQADEVLRLADSVIFLENGTEIFAGSKQEFLTRDQIPSITRFLNP